MRLVLTRPRKTFAAVEDGDVGLAWTFAALCCLLPRLLYGLLDGRGGPLLMLLRATLTAAVQAASATFFLGSLHFLFVLSVAPTQASWRISARAAGYAQAITLVLGSLVAGVVVVMPGWRASPLLRDLALTVSAVWYSVPLYWLGRECMLLRWERALYAALGASFGIALLLRTFG